MKKTHCGRIGDVKNEENELKDAILEPIGGKSITSVIHLQA